LTPIIDNHESELHKLCKESIFNDLKNKFPDYKWVCDDVRIPEVKEKGIPGLQPDIGGRINNIRVAIEIQTSALTIAQILKRCCGYSKRGISILWIVPLVEPIGEEIFRPRLFERYLHSIYFGRVYYWLSEYGCKVLPVHFSPALREIPYREWFEDGEERDAGGYDKPYKHIRKPVHLRPISIAENFDHMRRSEHRPWNERKTVPPMRILIDKEPMWWDKNEQKILDRYYKEDP
jgi:competence protein CoiA